MGAFMVILYPRQRVSTGISLMRLSPILCERANPHLVCPPTDSCGQRESNLGVVHETNEPCSLSQAPYHHHHHHIIKVGFKQYV